MEYANDATVDEAKDNHTQEPVYRDNGDGTHNQTYNCCGAEFVGIRHSFQNNSCVCGAFGDHWGDNCLWTLKDDVLEFYGTGVMQDRDGYDGYPWFNYDDNVTAVVVHEGITHICVSAFAYMGKLTSVTLPDSLISAGAGVFSGCGALESIRLLASLKHIPKSMLSLTGLRAVTIPEGVLSIGEAAFANCSNLTEVHLPQSLESIKRFAFAWSQNLDALDFSASVNFVGDEAFADTFARITVDPENPVFSTDADGSLYNKDKTTLYYCAVETGIYTVAATVTEVGPYAFEDVKCEQIILPEGLKTIGERAFQYVWITQITIPSTVETIADDAFRSTTYLKTADVHCSWDDENPLYDFDNDVEVRKVLHGPFDAESGLCRCGAPNPAFAAAVSKNGVVIQAYATISEAFAAVSTVTAADQAVVILLQDQDMSSSISVPASGTFVLDLNGFDINVKAASLSVIDSSATESVAGTGSLITNAKVTMDHTVNGMRYIALLTDGVYTFHRVIFGISQVSLRTSAAGLYYTATMACDPVLRDAISYCGIAVSTLYMPGADFEQCDDVLYTYVQGVPRARGLTSCAVFDIFKQDADNNAERGKMKIYANAYFKLDNGTMIMAYDNADQWVGTSLYDVLAALADRYLQSDMAIRDILNDFAFRWRDVITEYGFENLLDDQIPEAP
ncbi:MAG: leucine-rich repeat protein [Oscillospiraceae bacterium]|nr:leucine-rich repeat protein [Oscillospiraceae bacterium]